jgi:hypothetical protein
VTGSTITHNQAEGGQGGSSGGTAGQGLGGGVYIAGGALTLDAATIIAHNDASTSNDDIFP